MDEDFLDERDDGIPPDECYHEDYEMDILSGRATCHQCGHFFYPPRPGKV